jgi:hypothetical protein
MKKLLFLTIAAWAAIGTAAHAEQPIPPISKPTFSSVSIQLAEPANDVFIGNSIGWRVSLHDDHRVVTLTRAARYATATDLIFETATGVTVYDVARNGVARINDDRRIVRDGGALELAPVRVSILEFPAEIKRIEGSGALRAHLLVVTSHRYVALKYVSSSDFDPKRLGPLTVTTDSGKYSFVITAGDGGAPVYRVADGN